VHNFQRGLTAIETGGYFAVLLLPLMTSATGLAFAARWATATADLLGVGARIVREGREDGRAARMRVRGEDGDRGRLEKWSKGGGGG
jgi:hypothetical protein